MSARRPSPNPRPADGPQSVPQTSGIPPLQSQEPPREWFEPANQPGTEVGRPLEPIEAAALAAQPKPEPQAARARRIAAVENQPNLTEVTGIPSVAVVEHMSYHVGNAMELLWHVDQIGTQGLEQAIVHLQREIGRRNRAAKPRTLGEMKQEGP